MDELRDLLQGRREDSLNMVGQAVQNSDADPLTLKTAYDQMKDLRFNEETDQDHLRQKLMDMILRQKGQVR